MGSWVEYLAFPGLGQATKKTLVDLENKRSVAVSCLSNDEPVQEMLGSLCWFIPCHKPSSGSPASGPSARCDGSLMRVCVVDFWEDVVQI